MLAGQEPTARPMTARRRLLPRSPARSPRSHPFTIVLQVFSRRTGRAVGLISGHWSFPGLAKSSCRRRLALPESRRLERTRRKRGCLRRERSKGRAGSRAWWPVPGGARWCQGDGRCEVMQAVPWRQPSAAAPPEPGPELRRLGGPSPWRCRDRAAHPVRRPVPRPVRPLAGPRLPLGARCLRGWPSVGRLIRLCAPRT